MTKEGKWNHIITPPPPHTPQRSHVKAIPLFKAELIEGKIDILGIRWLYLIPSPHGSFRSSLCLQPQVIPTRQILDFFIQLLMNFFLLLPLRFLCGWADWDQSVQGGLRDSQTALLCQKVWAVNHRTCDLQLRLWDATGELNWNRSGQELGGEQFNVSVFCSRVVGSSHGAERGSLLPWLSHLHILR